MPRYHFHTSNGQRHSDEEGMELANDAVAHLEAVKYAGEILKNEPQNVWEGGQWRVEATDEGGRLLFTVITLSIDAPRFDQILHRP